MSKNLLLTLGHNSSAILVEDDKVICGYENERLSKVKSDSAFPSLAIMECLNNKDVYVDKLDAIYISYWNDSFDIFDDASIYVDKHIDRKFLNTLCKHYGCKIKYLSEDFTHHDAHAYAALNFFENHATDEDKMKNFHVIVSDGFGNKEEVTTVYVKDGDKLKVIDKYHDYFNSVGLMYQYATTFCGLKENEDEYKFLGYESHIKEVLNDSDIEKLYAYTDEFIKVFYRKANTAAKNIEEHDEYINVSKLIAVKEWWANEFDAMLKAINFDKTQHSVEELRSVVGAFIQHIIEQFIGLIISRHSIENVILSGGIFYNVKLNNFIMNKISGKICVYPLAGDQGAALGIYRKNYGKFDFKSLLIGKRSLKLTDGILNEIKSKKIKNFEYYEDQSSFRKRIVELLAQDSIVNVLTDNLEFGPRALGSTTTLALPTKKNVSYINKLNHRDDAMPMAPQILESKAKMYFGDQVDRIIGSNYYMIITMDQLTTPDESYIGISHKYPLKDVYSSRCQIIPDSSDQYIRSVLESLTKITHFVINTSCNEHGKPILMTLKDGLTNHINTSMNDDENRSYTLIGAFK